MVILAIVVEADVVAPNFNVAPADAIVVPGVVPDVATVTSHGLTVIVAPKAIAWGATNVDVVTVKLHEPTVVVPEALSGAVLTLNTGVAALVSFAENDSVVASVVPKSGTPVSKDKEAAYKTGVVVAVTGTTASSVTTSALGSEDFSPQAATRSAAAKAVPEKNATLMDCFELNM
jgi:hypothetical protein